MLVSETGTICTMVNTNVQSPVVLAGPGLRYKDFGNYGPGEYRELSNVEVTPQGTLRTRRAIVQPAQGTLDYTNVLRFVGLVDNFTWAVSETAFIPVGEQVYAGAIPDVPTALPDQAGNHYHQVVGFFKYNNLYYWLTENFDGVNVKFYVYSAATINATFASMEASKALITTVTPQTPDLEAYQNSFKKFFIFKDRLFLVTHAGVWFSKATDPKVWAVPSGGFFKVPDQEINDAVAVNDSVYIATNKTLHVFSYSVDPNADGYMRPLTGDLGAWSLCVNEGRVYASNKYGLFSITNIGVSRVLDFEQILTPKPGIRNSLVSFENYIMVIEYRVKNKVGENYSLRTSYRDGNDPAANVIVINMLNGAAHRIDFEDYVSLADPTQRGRIIAAFISKPAYDDDPTVVFRTGRISGSDVSTAFYIMDFPVGTATGADQIRDSGGVKYVKINQKVTIDSHVPDGNEMLMKKFRGLHGMAKLPLSDFELAVAYDNSAEVAVLPLDNSIIVGADPRPHYPFRLPMNQRGRSITLKFRTKNPTTVTGGLPPTHAFELSDLRLRWMFTKLATFTRGNSE